MKRIAWLTVVALLFTSCAHMMVWRSPGIRGKVKLVDRSGNEVEGNRKGIVVNIINTSAELGDSSASAVTDENGFFEVIDLAKGTIKLEIVKEGYKVVAQEFVLKSHERRTMDIPLQRLSAQKRRTIKMKKGREEIHNPGQVNIQPPSM